MNHIPIHLLQDRTTHGLQIQHFDKNKLKKDASLLGAHRDDHYNFFLLEEGSGSLMIDFNEVKFSGSLLYYVLPGQVHHGMKHELASGWFVAVDTSLVPQECRNVFEGGMLLQQPYSLDAAELRQCCTLLSLLFERYNANAANPLYLSIVHSLLQSFIVMAAGCYIQFTGLSLKSSRPAQLTSQFKNLLTKELRSTKSPADYAALLNISESYLSEALKKQTGFPASYWIQQEVIMEAKRLLYYSELSVKEIAHNLGYNDHSYFSRFFRKATGASAVTFREKYRK